MPAVEVIPAGASYNPTFEDHQVCGVSVWPNYVQVSVFGVLVLLGPAPQLLPLARAPLPFHLWNLPVQGIDHLTRAQHGVRGIVAQLCLLGPLLRPRRRVGSEG